MSELDPQMIESKVAGRNTKTKAAPSELEVQKETRLAEREKRLATGAKLAPNSAPELPPDAPIPPKLNRSMLLDKITAYRERFPNIKKRNNIGAKSSDEEILDELHYCELQLGSQGGTSSLPATVLYGTMLGIEKITTDYWNPLGLQLNGLGTVAQQNMDQFQPILDELMIKHNAGVYTSPEWRLILTIAGTVLTVNAANQNPETARAVKAMNAAYNPPAKGKDM